MEKQNLSLSGYLSQGYSDSLSLREKDKLGRIFERIDCQNLPSIVRHIYAEHGHDAFRNYFDGRSRVSSARLFTALGTGLTLLTGSKLLNLANTDWPSISGDSLGMVGAGVGLVASFGMAIYGLTKMVPLFSPENQVYRDVKKTLRERRER